MAPGSMSPPQSVPVRCNEGSCDQDRRRGFAQKRSLTTQQRSAFPNCLQSSLCMKLAPSSGVANPGTTVAPNIKPENVLSCLVDTSSVSYTVTPGRVGTAQAEAEDIARLCPINSPTRTGAPRGNRATPCCGRHVWSHGEHG